MADNVIPLRPATAPAEDGWDGRRCKCGQVWFKAKVCINNDGQVTSYADLFCTECGDAQHLGGA